MLRSRPNQFQPGKDRALPSSGRSPESVRDVPAPGRGPLVIGGLAAVIAGAVYLWTLSPAVAGGDSAELGCAARFLGVPHYPGYPLYVLLSRILDAILVNAAVATNVLSALAAAVTTGVLAVWIVGAAGSLGRSSRAVIPMVLAVTAGLSWAFSRPVWQFSVIAEVYTLAALLDAVFWLILFMWILRPASFSLAILAGYLAGLGTVHQPLLGTNAVVWLIVIGVLLARRRLTIPPRLLGPGLLILILPLLLLLIPPMRSAPGLAPDYLQSDGLLDGIRWFFGSGEFSRYGLRGGQELREASGGFSARMVTGWTPFLWPLAVLGLVLVVRRFGVVGITLGLTLLLRLGFAWSYRIVDNESYDVVVFLLAAFLAGYAITRGARVLLTPASGSPSSSRSAAAFRGRRRGIALSGAMVILMGVVVVNEVVHHRGVSSRRGFRLIDDFAADALGVLPPTTVLFAPTEHWAALYTYGNRVAGYGPDDLRVVDLSGRFQREAVSAAAIEGPWQRMRPAYLHLLLTRARDLGVLGDPLRPLPERESYLPPDEQVVALLQGRAVCAAMVVPDTTGFRGWQPRPLGFTIRVAPPSTPGLAWSTFVDGLQGPHVDLERVGADRRGFSLVDPILESYANAYRLAAHERLEAGDTQGAHERIDIALRLRPGSWSALALRAEVARRTGDRRLAMEMSGQALDANPGRGELARFYAECMLEGGIDRTRVIAFLRDYLSRQPGRVDPLLLLADLLEDDATTRSEALEAHRRALSLLPPRDPRRPEVEAGIARLEPDQ